MSVAAPPKGEPHLQPARPIAGVLLRVSERIDAGMAILGRVVALMGYATILICFATVYLRYAVGIGFTWLQESYIWTHALVIMLGSGYCLLKGGFVRVDMLYAKMSERGQAVVDLFGAVFFTLPFLVMAGWYGWPFFLSSYRMQERSAYDDGLGGLFILKGTLIVFGVIVGIQVFSTICRNSAVLLGAPASPREGGHP